MTLWIWIAEGLPGGLLRLLNCRAAQAQAVSLGFDPFKVLLNIIQDRSNQEIIRLADRYFLEVIALISSSNG